MSDPKQEPPPQPPPSKRPSSSSLFAVPDPIRRLFNRFPLHTYPTNALPTRCATASFIQDDDDAPVLYVFSDWEGATRGMPSYNPTCLKWQTYLKMCNIPHRLHPSTNHSSPSGSLPFLQPPSSTSSPIPSTKFPLYAQTHSSSPLPPPPPQDSGAYASLLETPIRLAYLHALYLSAPNTPLLETLYLLPSTTNLLVRFSLRHKLRAAAQDEIISTSGSPVLDPDMLYADASCAFAALEEVLVGGGGASGGDRTWFFVGREKQKQGPTEFDAAVFAYTNVILDERLGWVDSRLGDVVRAFPGLVRHRERILETYWPELA